MTELSETVDNLYEVAPVEAGVELFGYDDSSVTPGLVADFNTYSVSECLLLFIFLLFFVQFCLRILKEGFYWLL